MITGIAIGFAAALALWVGVSLLSPREVAPNIRSFDMPKADISSVFDKITEDDKCAFIKKVRAQSTLVMIRESEMLNEGYHQDWGDSVVHFDGFKHVVPAGWRAQVVQAKDLPIQVDILSK
jgi:hypothetical protein